MRVVPLLASSYKKMFTKQPGDRGQVLCILTEPYVYKWLHSASTWYMYMTYYYNYTVTHTTFIPSSKLQECNKSHTVSSGIVWLFLNCTTCSKATEWCHSWVSDCKVSIIITYHSGSYKGLPYSYKFLRPKNSANSCKKTFWKLNFQLLN